MDHKWLYPAYKWDILGLEPTCKPFTNFLGYQVPLIIQLGEVV